MKKKQKPSLKTYIVTCVILLVISGGLLPWTLSIAYNMTSSYFWETVPAMVTNHRMEKSQGSVRHANPLARYQTYVEYTYTYNSQEFTSERVQVFPTFHGTAYENQGWRYAQAHYPIGSTVSAYIHPKNPSYSVLEPGVSHWLAFLCLCILIAMPIMAIGGLLFGTRSKVFRE